MTHHGLIMMVLAQHSAQAVLRSSTTVLWYEIEQHEWSTVPHCTVKQSMQDRSNGVSDPVKPAGRAWW